MKPKTAGGRTLPPSRLVLRGDQGELVKIRLALLTNLEEPSPNKCLEFTGAVKSTGYGQMWLCGSAWNAHRVAYAIKTGQWPGKWQIRHVCGNRKCVNPYHLKRGTKQQNERDKYRGERRTYKWKNQHGKG